MQFLRVQELFIPINSFPAECENLFADLDSLNTRIKNAICKLDLFSLRQIIDIDAPITAAYYSSICRKYGELKSQNDFFDDIDQIHRMYKHISVKLDELAILKSKALDMIYDNEFIPDSSPVEMAKDSEIVGVGSKRKRGKS
jgi:hypothetical protein